MKDQVFRVLDALLMVMIFILALYILLMLFTGGSPDTAYGLQIKLWNVYSSIMVLLTLAILRFPFRYRTLFQQVFLAHEGALLFLVFLLIYLANARVLASGDTLPARYLPMSILYNAPQELDK